MDASIAIRLAIPADAFEIARVRVNSWRTTYQGIVADQTLADLSVERGAESWRQQLAASQPGQATFVAVQGERIIGFAASGPERSSDIQYKGEIYALYLLQAVQRQGIGRKLVEASVESLLANGLSSMLIWVLHDNPSREFYEALGGQYLREQVININAQGLIEVAYGWKDISTLVEKHA
jgi:ribosomal protein S18 acetylase RimI-like enzyme